MKLVLFSHSIRSCWNHGNAHFQRGLLRALAARGWETHVQEPAHGWSVTNLRADHGDAPIEAFARAYPEIIVHTYDRSPDLDRALDAADLVLVAEWTDPDIVRALGRRRAAGGAFRLFFHDTHHRAVSAPDTLPTDALDAFDGVLAFCASLAETYRRKGWSRSVHVLHEAADISRFRPHARADTPERAVFVGNWGDGERDAELFAYVVAPCAAAGVPLDIFGVRWPAAARARLSALGARHRGWLANLDAPARLAAARYTIHAPRSPYRTALPGAPTIRVFEALACGAPLASAPWEDCEHLFVPGRDYLAAKSPAQMQAFVRALAADDALCAELAAAGPRAVAARHTCDHRADELLALTGFSARGQAA